VANFFRGARPIAPDGYVEYKGTIAVDESVMLVFLPGAFCQLVDENDTIDILSRKELTLSTIGRRNTLYRWMSLLTRMDKFIVVAVAGFPCPCGERMFVAQQIEERQWGVTCGARKVSCIIKYGQNTTDA
jgi:hypothetical protein